MGKRTEVVEIRYTADISGLKAELQKLPGLSKKQVGTMIAQANQAAKANESAARRTSRAWGRGLKSASDGSRRFASVAQGNLGRVTSAILDSGEALVGIAKGLGPAGVAGGAVIGFAASMGLVVVANVKAAQAMLALVDSTAKVLDDAERLGAIERIIDVDNQQVDALRDSASAMQDIRDAAAAVTFEIGAFSATDLQDELQVAAAIGMDLARSAESTFEWFTQTAGKLGIINEDALEYAVAFGLVSKESAKQVKFNAVMREQERQRLELIKKYEPITRKLTDQKDAEAKAAEKALKAAERQAAAEKRLQGIAAQGLQGRNAVRAAFARQLKEIDKLEQVSKNSDLAQHARDMAKIDRDRKLGEIDAKAAQERQRTMEAEAREQERRADQRRRHHEELQRQFEEEQAWRRAQVDASVNGFVQMGSAVAGFARARADSLEEGTKAHRQAALEAFRIEQVTAAAQAAIHGGLAVTRALAELGPIAGPIAAVAMSAAIAAEIAGILAQSPPQAHLGSGGQVGRSGPNAPDEATMRVRNGEVVQTAQQAQRGQGTQRPLVARFENKFFDMTTDSQLRKDGPMRRAFDEGETAGVIFGF